MTTNEKYEKTVYVDVNEIDVDKVHPSNNKKDFSQQSHSKKKDKKPNESVNFISLFRYATFIDIICMLIGTIGGIVQGSLFPLMVLIFGELLNTLTNRTIDLCTLNFTSIAIEYCPTNYELTALNYYISSSICHLNLTNTTTLNLEDSVTKYINYLIILGCVSIISSYTQVVFWSISAERQTRVIRENLFRSILRKDITYFDTHQTGELNTKLTNNIQSIYNGIGDKLGSTTRFISSFLIRIVIGFIKGWKLTLVIISISPLLFIAFFLFAKVASSLTTMELKAYERAGAIAEEVFSSIRTVFSYNGQQREEKRYDKHLDEAKRNGIKKGAITGLTLGFMWFLVYCAYALGFWYGAKLIRDEGYSIGNVSIVFFSIILAIFNLAQVGPHFQAVIQARAAAYLVWQVIDTPSKIDIDSKEGFKVDDLISNIHFSNVHFSYPSQPNVKILNGISFDIEHGQTIALVGSSGSGKSTCIQLLQRFYDPNSGSILIDKHQLNEYNLKWLREQIGVVSQEPILFDGTIRENILLGKDTATDLEIYQAAKMANAHDFIINFPDKYDTYVGERGTALSGGQKQRIAIARALIRDPKILLLDEATSALDNKSEKIVQEALDRAREGRTTIIVAHRLSTIRNVDKIIVIDKGMIVEQGTHQSLIDAQGVYFGLVEQQNLPELKEKTHPINYAEQENIKIISTDHIEEEEEPSSIINTLFENKDNSISKDSIDKKTKNNITFQMLLMNKPEWLIIIFGCISCICNGGIQPAFGIILSKLTAVFQECDEQIQKERVLLYILLFIGFAVLVFITIFSQNFLFAWSGESLTKRLRSKSFRAILCQEIAYFDNPKNNIGALCTRLGSEASTVQGATGIYIGTLLQNLAALSTSVIISFIFSWQLTLLSLTFVPFLIIRGFIENYLMSGFTRKDKQIYEDVSKVTVESIQNIRTVIQLTKEDYFYQKYSMLLEKPYKSAMKRAQFLALFFALICSVIYFSLAALFKLGATLLIHNTTTLEDILLCFNCLILGAQNVGEKASLSPDYTKGIRAAEKIFELLKRKPLINNDSCDGEEISDLNGELEFDNVQFIYPNRSRAIILNSFKLKIQPGQHIALVGASGSGKSTIIQLIERFYDVNNGQLLVDSKDIRNLNLQWYRSQIGIVSQEPILFNMSIRENIAYGDNHRNDIPIEEIIQAAKNANIHNFIEQLPEGYETNCGAKGSQLSGGQKQRIAIARALIRNPKILLLDEATSALDSESEKIVQEALDHAQLNRTSITIAHRLSTIQNADMIYVLHDGMIIESGTHQELMDLVGHYYHLVIVKHQ